MKLTQILCLVGVASAASLNEMINTNLAEAQQTNQQQYNAKLSLDKYTLTLASLFIVQLIFCFGIISYTNSKVKAIELRNESQKADFYSFLY